MSASGPGARWSPSTIGSYERMDRVPNIGVLTALARLYRVSPAWLVGDQQPWATGTTGLTLDRTALSVLSTVAAATVEGIVAARGAPADQNIVTLRAADLPLLAAI